MRASTGTTPLFIVGLGVALSSSTACSGSDSGLGAVAADAGPYGTPGAGTGAPGGAGGGFGGANATGGAFGTGGASFSGGSSNTGNSPGDGGASSGAGATGGSPSTGGAIGSGAAPSSGGSSAAGGAESGGTGGPGGDAGAGGTVFTGGATGAGGVPASGGGTGTGGAMGSCTTPPPPSPLLGWASVEDNGVQTIGGDGGSTTTVTTLSDLNAAVKGTTPAIVIVRGTIDGDVTIGSNKTLVGLCGATIHGYVSLNKSVNVIVRNLAIVGKNCTDSPNDCSAGDDAVTVQGGAHHLWFDHDDISDGSDGNLDMTHASDFITISWTKFHYSGRRTDPAGASGGHQFSNLIGHSDSNAAEDTGHLRITFHHSWWADNVVERMPRARFGQVHIFDNLYTATGNDYCIGVGNGVNIRSENNVFIGVANPIKSYSTDGTGLIRSTGNVYTNTTGTNADLGTGTVFTPSYSVTPDPTDGLEAAIRAGAGPH